MVEEIDFAALKAVQKEKKKTKKAELLENLDLNKIVETANQLEKDFKDLIPNAAVKKTTRKRTIKPIETQADNEIHLEDLFITKIELWTEMAKVQSGALKNWFTKSHPKSDICKRDSEVSDIATAVNTILMKKLMEAKKHGND